MLHVKPVLGEKALGGRAMNTPERQRTKPARQPPAPQSPREPTSQALAALLHRELCQISAARGPGWKTRTPGHLESTQLHRRARMEAEDSTISALTAAQHMVNRHTLKLWTHSATSWSLLLTLPLGVISAGKPELL